MSVSDSRVVLLGGVVVLSVATAVVVTMLLPRTGAPAETSSPAASIDEERLAAIAERLERLEERGGSMMAAPSEASGKETRTARQPVGGTPSGLAGLAARVARLEEIERKREDAVRERVVQREQRDAERSARRAQLVAKSRQTIMDSSATDQQKVMAWRQLRSDAKQHWTDAVVQELVRIGTTSSDAKLRADVWRQADANATHPLLVTPLLRALQHDPVADVREEAAETLENYAGQPGIQQALRSASQHDAEEKVRRIAARSLERGLRARSR